MRLWTYGEIRKKIERDLDLEDETFISADELAGYCNEGIDSAEAEIMKLNEDYFLKSKLYDLTVGQSTLVLPTDIYAQKIRALIYNNGGDLIYALKRIRGANKFSDLAEIQVWTQANWLSYIVQNQSAGEQNTILLAPSAQVTASNVLTLWYIRNAVRVPMLGEYVIALDFLPADIDVPTSTFLIDDHGYVTGDKVKISLGTTTSVIPSGITADRIYFVIRVDDDQFYLADTLSDARAGVKVVPGDAGTGSFVSTVATTVANRDEIVLDIPEFTTYLIQFMKVRCYEKEPDPRYDGAVGALAAHQKQMVETLTEQVPDDDNKVLMDMGIYEDMS